MALAVGARGQRLGGSGASATTPMWPVLELVRHSTPGSTARQIARACPSTASLPPRLEIHTPRLYSSGYCAPAVQGERGHRRANAGGHGIGVPARLTAPVVGALCACN